MSTTPLPNYETLFGNLDFKEGDDSRSVYSPAAYLADLIQLLENYTTPPEDGDPRNLDFHQRRKDIQDLPLNGENTFSIVPYLEIANKVLEDLIDETDPYAQLQEAVYPMGTPFHLEHERVRTYLNYLQVSWEEVYKLFASAPLASRLASDYLGLSQDLYELIIHDASPQTEQLETYFGISAPASLNDLTSVSTFMNRTGLSGAEVRELLLQGLSETARDGSQTEHEGFADQLFVNFNPNSQGYVSLNAEETHFIWINSSDGTRDDSIPNFWLDRVNRLIRLSKATGIAIKDLDLIIRSCCDHALDENAIIRIAILRHIQEKFEAEIEQVLSLISPIVTSGIGSEDDPKDLFNRVFNHTYASIEKKYLKLSPFLPEVYEDFTEMTMAGDLFALENKSYRQRLQRTLRFSAKQLRWIFDAYEQRYEDNPDENVLSGDLEIEAFTLLYRISVLSEWTELRPEELFGLIEVLEKTPSIKSYNVFQVFILLDLPGSEMGSYDLDCYAILQGSDTQMLLWLHQMIVALSSWMANQDITSQELKQITLGEHSDLEAQQFRFIRDLHDQLTKHFLSSDDFLSELHNQRSARIIHHSLTNETPSPLSNQDARLVHLDPDLIRQASYQAILQLPFIRQEDFLGLGLHEKMLDKLYSNLILYSWIDAEGNLIGDRFPTNAEELILSTDFSENQGAIFELIFALYTEDKEELSADNDPISDVEFSIFPSDLTELKLSEPEKKELYDNLIYHGYIDEAGNVLQVEFFANPDHQAAFRVSVQMQDFAARVHEIFQHRLDQFEAEDLILKEAWFEAVGLDAKMRQELIQNLQFNDYIDVDGRVLDKSALLGLGVKEFQLGIAFYPKRHAILKAIQEGIRSFQIGLNVFPKDMFQAVAEDMLASLIVNRLQEDYFPNGLISEEQATLFEDPSAAASFDIDPYFNSAQSAVVFQTLAHVVSLSRQVQLTDHALSELNVSEEEVETIKAYLKRDQFLSESGSIPLDKLPFFLDVQQGLTFEVEGFEDYNKDIFFLLHDIAQSIDLRLTDIASRLTGKGEMQVSTLFGVLAEELEVSEGMAKVIYQQVLGVPATFIDPLLLPILEQVDGLGRILDLPSSRTFQLAYRRMKQFALLAGKLGLDATDAKLLFEDQDLADKFPENLILPNEVSKIDALLAGMDDSIYLFSGDRYWIYDAETYEREESAYALEQFSDAFQGLGLQAIDAAFVEQNGDAWIISGTHYFCKKHDRDVWLAETREWGQLQNNFTDASKIDGAYTDQHGTTYLFAGDQYIRYSHGYLDEQNEPKAADEGYPKLIRGNWIHEITDLQLPLAYASGIDAGFQAPLADKTIYLFKDGNFISSDDPGQSLPVSSVWGKVNNQFEQIDQVDAALWQDDSLYFFSGDQVIAYKDSLEQEEVYVSDGMPNTISNVFELLPPELTQGIDAAARSIDNISYFFKDDQYVSIDASQTVSQKNLVDDWGKVNNAIQSTGTVNAAFTGLDGRVYLFSGDQYVRYSGSNYHRVDEGYPRFIEEDWGGLKQVTSAFVLDGNTYLFGLDQEGLPVYVRYSRNEYEEVDEGYPKEFDNNWWNLPLDLPDFFGKDASGNPLPDELTIFTGLDQKTYLLVGNQFSSFDHNRRWWSEPQLLSEAWNSIPFASIDAGFTGKDSKTYLFSGDAFIQFSDSSYEQVDDRFPQKTITKWGKVYNTIARTHRVDAAVALHAQEPISDEEDSETESREYFYLFSGKQYYRYTGSLLDSDGNIKPVDMGYPKSIKTSLRKEVRFEQLAISLHAGIDAVFADERTVYVLQGDQIYLSSTDLDKHINSPLGEDQAPIQTVIQDHGSVYVEMSGQWQRVSHPERAHISLSPVSIPPSLRHVDPEFQTGMQAILKGTDGHTYLFQKESATCYQVLLGTSYPTKEEWGRVRNRIEVDNAIDAAFTGLDGNVYLFRGDQFVTYELESGDSFPVQSSGDPRLVEGLPESISDHWGGLNQVSITYVQGEHTYLFEQADQSGNMRYVRYSGSDYSKPDRGYPMVTDINFWEIPSIYQEEGFRQVHAVLVQGDNLLFLNDSSFIQFNTKEDVWTYPRPLERLWPHLPTDNEDFETLQTAFVGPDEIIHFFSTHHFITYSDNADDIQVQAIKEVWGILDNNITQTGIVNACLLDPFGNSFLFSGDQYVRYSNSDYRFVDDGYPKNTADHLPTEKAFANLPDSFREIMHQQAEQDRMFDALWADQRTVYILYSHTQIEIRDEEEVEVQQTHLQLVSTHQYASIGLDRLGKVRNTLAQTGTVDAAFVRGEVTYLLSEDQYIRYSGPDYRWIDKGYPKLIENHLTAELSSGSTINLVLDSGNFASDLDAAFWGIDSCLYLFKGMQSLRIKQEDGSILEGSISQWSAINNAFDDQENTPIDAAFVAPNGNLYVFKEGKYLKYSDPSREQMDEGYPKSIKDNWGNLPPDFENGGEYGNLFIDGGFVFEGRTYLTRGEEYVRYSDDQYRTMDAIYPQQFSDRWRDWSDYQLADIWLITQYKELANAHDDPEEGLTAFLGAKNRHNNDPFAMLEEMFGWEIEESKWLQRQQAFINRPNEFEADLSLEELLKMVEIFRIADKFRAGPSQLYEEIWQKIYGSTTNLEAAADSIYAFLGTKQSQKDWDILYRELRDILLTKKRDVLVPYVVAHWNELSPSNSSVENSRDLYEQLLIDVETESCAEISYIKEAILALQLYFHRYFVNLESIDPVGEYDAAARAELKEQWQWMKNYRVWEANRKVFLYPENYIRPELRDSKTPSFQTLEEDLLQGEVNESNIEGAYKKYLDNYTEVSRLTISGGHTYSSPNNPDDEELILFGHTKTEPPIYYYRTSLFVDGQTDSAIWEAWKPADIQIDAPRVFPVFAFGRIFVFWMELTVETKDSTSTKLKVEGGGSSDQEYTNKSETYNIIKIKYSFYNLNEQWIPPQILKEVKVEGAVQNYDLYIEDAQELDGNLHQNIQLSCSYNYIHYSTLDIKLPLHFKLPLDRQVIKIPQANERNETIGLSLTPELTVNEHARRSFNKPKLDIINTIFGDEEAITLLSQNKVFPLNKSQHAAISPWFVFDHKGGSFLCKPGYSSLSVNDTARPLPELFDALPEGWNRIDAAFHGPDGKSYFFHNDDHGSNHEYATGTYSGGKFSLSDPEPIYKLWGSPNLLGDGHIDAAWNNDGRLYLFQGDSYILYSEDLEFADADSPLLISAADELPSWDKIDAVLNGLNGETYFFKEGEFVSSSDLTSSIPISDKWGKISNSLSDYPDDIDDRVVCGALVVGGPAGNSFTYLFTDPRDGGSPVSDAQLFRYSGADYQFADEGYPIQNDLASLLDELAYSGDTSEYIGKKVTGAYAHDGKVYINIQAANKNYILDQSDLSISEEDPYSEFRAGFVIDGVAYRIGIKELTNTQSNTTLALNKNVNAAFHGQDGHVYFFYGIEFIQVTAASLKEEGVVSDANIVSAIDTWANPVIIKTSWGAVRNNFATGSIDAAYSQDDHTYLISGDEYIRYSGSTYEFIDDGYPQKLNENSDGLPAWTQLDAILPDIEGAVHFFRNDHFASSDDLDALHVTTDRWGNAAPTSTFATDGIRAAYTFPIYEDVDDPDSDDPTDTITVLQDHQVFLMDKQQILKYSNGTSGLLQAPLSDYPKTFTVDLPKLDRVHASFVCGGEFYLVSDDFFFCCPVDEPTKVKTGYPKSGKLGALIQDILDKHGKENPSALAYNPFSVTGGYVYGNQVVLQSHIGPFSFLVEVSLTDGNIRLTFNAFGLFGWHHQDNTFDAAYVNSKNEIQRITDESYDSAAVIGSDLYLFKGSEYMIVHPVPDEFPLFNSTNWQPEADAIGDVWDWSVDSAFSLLEPDQEKGEGHAPVYLISQNKYFKLENGEEPLTLSNYRAIESGWANLYPELVDGFDASLNTGNDLFFFKDGYYFHYDLSSADEPRPFEVEKATYDLVRLTSGTAAEMNQKLFSGGINSLLSLQTQQIDETPGFSYTQSTSTLIKVKAEKIGILPVYSHLDFNSANGIYYWEMFFHAPFLIAQAFNTAQRFEEAKTWYEHIFDPTDPGNYWKFLPFLTVDVAAILDNAWRELDELDSLGVQNLDPVRKVFVTPPDGYVPPVSGSEHYIYEALVPVIDVFQGHEAFEPGEESDLEALEDLSALHTAIMALPSVSVTQTEEQIRFETARDNLLELVAIIEKLPDNFDLMQTNSAQIRTYLDDPFDPHAIASLRKIAYRKAILMRYIDNLLDWGDLLFGQYTMESINEARMLYILAYDLLGKKPENLGSRILSDDKSYRELYDPSQDYDLLLLELENNLSSDNSRADIDSPTSEQFFFSGTVHDSIVDSTYFFVPENELFLEYWDRVEDRLYKIRHCLNILGFKQPLPLFQPPIDPMALVRAASSGAGLSQIVAGLGVPVPHYRFTFMVNKANHLIGRLNQYSADLLAALEKKDAEALSLLQNKHEGEIFKLMTVVKEAQLEEARSNLLSLQESKENASIRSTTYQGLMDAGISVAEAIQMGMMVGSSVLHFASAIIKVGSVISHAVPNFEFGPFSTGAETGGNSLGSALDSGSESLQSIAEGLSMIGEVIGIGAQHQRMQEEWDLQKKLADSDVKQIEHQIKGAEWQIKIAEQEIRILEKEIEQNTSMKTFMKDKFTNEQLYQWMAGKLSGLFFQTYKLAHDMAKYAEKAFQFEKGLPVNEVSFINGFYWDSQRKGLLAGEALSLDLDRMEQAYVERDANRFEITRKISLLEHDPLAFLQLRDSGQCEFNLTEAFFDYDFPGHYCRQMKTISVSFEMGEGTLSNGTLTQLSNRTVMKADPKAVKFLLDPKDTAPTTIRSGWKAHQQIALSHHDEFAENNGLFELRFDSEKYLPFEGTGAVSSWRLELNGKRSSYNLRDLSDVSITVKYTALQGGEAFSTAVKGMLKPYQTSRIFNLQEDFFEQWSDFLANEEESFSIPLSRDLFPAMSGGKISGVLAHVVQSEAGNVEIVLNEDEEMTLEHGKFVETSSLSISSRGSELSLTIDGDKQTLENLLLVMSYKAKVE